MAATAHATGSLAAPTRSGQTHRVIADVIPLFRLRIRTPRLELRLPHPDELPALGAAAAIGAHGPDERPFLAPPGGETPWTLLPPEERARSVVQWQLAALGQWRPEDWRLELAVFAAGEPIGVQSVHGEHFRITEQVMTGSWLRLDRRGGGLGTEMREAVLAFVFEHLGARWARTTAFEDNYASRRITEKLGYVPDGFEISARDDGNAHRTARYRLNREDWRSGRDVEVTGFEDCRSWFGLEER